MFLNVSTCIRMFREHLKVILPKYLQKDQIECFAYAGKKTILKHLKNRTLREHLENIQK